jgi:hypothetical protein
MKDAILPIVITLAILAWTWISEKAHKRRMADLRKRFPWLDP